MRNALGSERYFRRLGRQRPGTFSGLYPFVQRNGFARKSTAYTGKQPVTTGRERLVRQGVDANQDMQKTRCRKRAGLRGRRLP